jgi:hypothetical protein
MIRGRIISPHRPRRSADAPKPSETPTITPVRASIIDILVDTIADVCAADDSSAIVELYSGDELRVPPELIV